MVKHQETGEKGENKAIEYLVSKNYEVLERNWHFKHKEIDIIAKKDNLLVIIEVKSRHGESPVIPEEIVTRKKQRFIIDAANAYIVENRIDLETRFDVIFISFTGYDFSVEHIVNAFYPIVS